MQAEYIGNGNRQATRKSDSRDVMSDIVQVASGQNVG